MKCSICGKEFGEGVNCQNCGVDRVTGLANYSGHGTSDYQGAKTSHYDSSYNSSPKTMVCHACGEIIPSNSEYCPYCSKELYVKCPKCGNTYSSQFPACNKCGTNRKQYYRQLEAEKKEAERLEKERIQEQERRDRIEKQHQQQNDHSSKWLFKLLGFLVFIIGGVLLVVTITEHGSETFRQKPSEEIMSYLLAIVLLVVGFSILYSKKTD